MSNLPKQYDWKSMIKHAAKHKNKAQSTLQQRQHSVDKHGVKSLSVKKQFQRIKDEEAKKYQPIKFQPSVLSASRSCDLSSPQRHQVDVAEVLKGGYVETSEVQYQPTPQDV